MSAMYLVIIGICILLIICSCLSVFIGILINVGKNEPKNAVPIVITQVATPMNTLSSNDTFSDSNLPYAYTKLETEDDIIKGRTSDEAIVNDIGKALKNYDLPYLGEEISTSEPTFKYEIIYSGGKRSYITSNSNMILRYLISIVPKGSTVIQTNAITFESISIVKKMDLKLKE